MTLLANSLPFVQATVRRVVSETSRCRTFELDLPKDSSAAFVAKPGQFVTVRVAVDGVSHERCYSLSSVAELDPHLCITVKRLPEGVVSNWCCENLRPGTAIAVAPPAGRFLLRSGSGPLLFCAAGSGITPVYALLRYALRSTERAATLLYRNRTPSDAIFLESLYHLVAAHPGRFTLIESYSEGAPDFMTQVLPAALAEAVRGDLYVCGPARFMADVETTAISTGFPMDRIALERFTAEPQIEIQALLSATSHASAEVAQVEVRLDGADHHLVCAPGQTLLEALLAAGLPVPFSCQEGHCGACMVRLAIGTVDALPGAALSRRDRQKGYILACRARPTAAEIAVSYDK